MAAMTGGEALVAAFGGFEWWSGSGGGNTVLIGSGSSGLPGGGRGGGEDIHTGARSGSRGSVSFDPLAAVCECDLEAPPLAEFPRPVDTKQGGGSSALLADSG